MTPSPRALRLNTVELLRQPGTRRPVDVEVAPAELAIDDPRISDAIEVDLEAESTNNGIVVTGTVGVEWSDECRRCLRPVQATVGVEVDELYQDDVSDPDAFEIGPDALDLAPMVRDHVLLALDTPGPLCRDDCAGICPSCGAELADGPCGCDTTVRDERWAALDDLHLDE